MILEIEFQSLYFCHAGRICDVATYMSMKTFGMFVGSLPKERILRIIHIESVCAQQIKFGTNDNIVAVLLKVEVVTIFGKEENTITCAPNQTAFSPFPTRFPKAFFLKSLKV